MHNALRGMQCRDGYSFCCDRFIKSYLLLNYYVVGSFVFEKLSPLWSIKVATIPTDTILCIFNLHALAVKFGASSFQYRLAL